MMFCVAIKYWFFWIFQFYKWCMVIRAGFNWVSKVMSHLLWVFIATLCDWLKKNHARLDFGFTTLKWKLLYQPLNDLINSFLIPILFTQVKGQRLVYKFNNLPYKYEPGVTRTFYRERFQRKNTSFREQGLQTIQPLVPQILSSSPLATSVFPSASPLLNSRFSWPVIPVPSPQVCWCMKQVPCVSSLSSSTSRIFFPVSSLSASRGFKPGKPTHCHEANSWSSGKPGPVSVIMKASSKTKISCWRV